MTIIPHDGWHLTEMIRRDGARELTALYVIGENPAQSEADAQQVDELLERLDYLVVQDIFLTKTAQLADVVFPAVGDVGRGRRHGDQQRAPRPARAVRRSTRPATRATSSGSSRAREAARLDWGEPTAEQVWDELRSLARCSPV